MDESHESPLVSVGGRGTHRRVSVFQHWLVSVNGCMLDGRTDEVPEARGDGRIYLRTKSPTELEGTYDNMGKIVPVKCCTETYYKDISWRKR